jgi:hypothetical protein
MYDDRLVRHDIAIRNILYGQAHFITLRLPESWDIAPGVSHPEIAATHERHNRRLVACGRAWYVLYHRERGWAVELLLESSPQRQRKLKSPEGGETLEVHGHPAQVRRWQRRRGLFRPKTISFVEVTYNCEQSDRRIRLELSGRCPPEGFEEVLRLVPEWWCH